MPRHHAFPSSVSHPSRRQALQTAGAVALAAALPGVAAAAEPGLVIYSTTHPSIQAKLNQAFQAKTGIVVQSMRLNSSGLAQRYMAELKAQQYLCDILTLGNDIFLNDLASRGAIVDLSGESWYGGLGAFWRPATHFIRTTASPGGIAYHPQQIDPAKAPTTWQALLNPAYKGNMFMTDPRANDSFLTFPAMLRELLGDKYLVELGRQDLALVPVTSQGVEQVIAGERALVFPCNPGDLDAYAGKGVIAFSTVDSPYWTSYFGSISSKAPHPQAARQYMAYLMSPAGQEILCKGVSVSPLPDIPGAMPQPTGRFVDVPIATALAERDQLFDLLGLPA